MFWPAWFSRTQLHLTWINPFTILMTITLPVELLKLIGGPIVLIDDGIFDSGYQYAVLMNNISIVMQTLSLTFFFHFFRVIRADRFLPLRRLTLRRRDLKRVACSFFILFLSFLYLLASAEFGTLNWLMNPREGYQLYRTGQGHWYALAISSLSVSFLFSLFGAPKPRAVLRTTVFYIGSAWLLGSKGILLSIFGFALVFLWFLQWRHLARFVVFGTPVLFALLVANLYLALADGFELRSILEYFDYYKNAADYYTSYANGELSLFYGKVLSSQLWNYVPRFFWPDKPTIYGILYVNELFYPGQAEVTNTPAFGGAVEQFADFGITGVFGFGLINAASIISALLFYFIYRRPGINLHKVTMATVLLMLAQYAPAFGSFFPGGLYVILIVIIMVMIRIIRVFGGRRREDVAWIRLSKDIPKIR